MWFATTDGSNFVAPVDKPADEPQPLAELATISDLERTPAIGFKGEARPGMVWSFGVYHNVRGVAVASVGKSTRTVLLSLEYDVFTGIFLSVYPFLAPPRRRKIDSVPPQPQMYHHDQKSICHTDNIEYVSSIAKRTTVAGIPAAAKPAPKRTDSRKPL